MRVGGRVGPPRSGLHISCCGRGSAEAAVNHRVLLRWHGGRRRSRERCGEPVRSASHRCLSQDFSVPVKDIWSLWQQRKMSHETCKQQLLESRHIGATRHMTMLDAHIAEEQRVQHEVSIARARETVELDFRSFRKHPLLDEFMAQFRGVGVKPQARYRCLLLRGESRSGKTQRALSLFGSERTLSVNCQGVSPGLPSIRSFTPSRYEAILWDECTEQQVLHNKLCFQSGLQIVTLGQSACNAFAYDVLLHAVPMLLCSNTFSMTHSGGEPLPDEDAQWLRENVIEVRLEPGQKWYLDAEE